MKTRLLMVMLGVAGLAFSVALSAADKAKEDPLAGVTCPLSGKAVKADAKAAYKDGEVYFCCENCPKAFAANTAKFASKANMQLVSTGQYKQKACPLTGRDLNPEMTVDVGSSKVTLCCGGCKGKASKLEGDALVDCLFNDKSFEKGFAKAEKSGG
ncbi:MAG: hypothetical protein KDA41_05985 [Planctomycetales bacterium]|nr:hypothetical protein [Planctomycetales bacterium]